MDLYYPTTLVVAVSISPMKWVIQQSSSGGFEWATAGGGK
jgi:hypothetical protein